MRGLFIALALLTAAPAFAQVNSRPTDPPIVTAENESWYRLAEPVQFAGDLYYPAGATVFFNGNVMVRTGHYNGIPLYADTTIEPYSIVYVPVARGVMQPYEKPRRGDLAGTTGSRTPSFPVSTDYEGRGVLSAAVSPTNLPQPLGAISAYSATGAGQPLAPAAEPQAATPEVVLLRPENNDGVWVRYNGAKWISAGSAVPLRASEFQLVGEYYGFPVFARQGVTEDVIYIPSRAGLIAPYRKKP
ncbi:MAG TPA: hypothetical protein VFV95_05220 [Vicinamibacterales bacterium]|nr:hypothetical protein [Vicinamibacterales bacterium]